jgi:DNA-binding LytR/AlgR family response regulator
MNILGKINYWRIGEPILLGSLANIFINIAFNPSNPDSSLQEFVVAILLCIPITELNRYIDLKLESKYSWTIAPKKRFFYNLLYLVLTLLFTLNVLGNIYMILMDYSFYTWDELLVINIITFTIALLFTIFKWTTHFYKKWKKTELNLNDSNLKFNELSSKMEESLQSITLQKMDSKIQAKVSNIRIAKSEYEVVKVFMESGEFYIFHGTLSKLASLLPEHLFFPVTRNILLHRKMIQSITSSTYGKVALKISTSKAHDESVTVSRPKASTFRKWYNSTLPINQ